MTTQQAADEWGVSPNSVKKLIATGVLHRVVSRGVRSTLPVEDVQALAGRPWLEPSVVGTQELPVLRVKAAAAATDDATVGDREWQGFHANLSPVELWAGLRGWWRVDPEKVATAGLLPVTVSGFVVAILVGLKEYDSRQFATSAGKTELRHRFGGRLGGYVTDLVAPTWLIPSGQPANEVDIVMRILGNRIATTSGGPIAYARTPSDSAGTS